MIEYERNEKNIHRTEVSVMKWMDMHCDTVSELFRKRSEGTLWKNKLCVDIERLKKSDSVAQFFACGNG